MADDRGLLSRTFSSLFSRAAPRPEAQPEPTAPGDPGKFFIPELARVIQIEEMTEVKLRVPLLLRSPDDAERGAIMAATSNVFGSAFWPYAGQLGLRPCSYSQVTLVGVAVPPWEGWRPSWDARFDPGTLEVRRGVNAPALSAPLLALADAYLGGAMAPAEGVTAHCDHCQTEQPRNAQQPDCPKCGGPLRLSAAVAAPTPRAAVKEAPHDLGRLIVPLDLSDMDDLFIQLRDTGMPPRPSKRAEYEAWRQDFLCHVELTLVVKRRLGS